MARSRATSDIQQATIKKTKVSTLPPWAKEDQLSSWNSLLNARSDLPSSNHSSVSNSSTDVLVLHSTNPSSSTSTLPRPTATPPAATSAQWSDFATMSVVQTVSERLAKKQPVESTVDKPSALDTTYVAPESLPKTHSPSRRSHYTQRLSEIFRYNKAVDSESQGATNCVNADCTCSCHHHRLNMSRFSMTRSRKQTQKHSMELMRGYLTGECVSSSDPPPPTAWDTPEEATDSKNSLLLQEQRQSWRTNTAFNLETIKMLLNSPLFSNFVKSLTVMAAVSILAIALDAIHLLRQHDGVTEAAASPLMNANASLYITVVLSILTIAYSCFTIFLDSRRPPEGLDSSDSKPFIVIFFEIMASTIWAQVLSVSIFLYTWTLGCSDAGARQMDELLSPFLEVAEETRYHYLVARMCRREGTMVGLELLLVLLLIFNFYTHLAQNFQFIRAVSR